MTLRRRAVMVGVIAGATVFGIYLGLWAALILFGLSGEADFTAFYTGWTIVAQGHGSQLYDPAIQAEVQRQVLGGLQFQAGLNPFNNPPHLVLPFLPLTIPNLAQSYLIWAAIQLGLLGWLLWRLLTRVAADWTGTERALLVAAALAAPPLVMTLLQGALSPIATVATLELYLALRDRRDKTAGIALVLASLKPQVALAPAVALVAGRWWRSVAVAAAVGLVLVLAATLVMGPGIWLSYLRFLGDYYNSFNVLSVDPGVMWNLRGTLTLLLRPGQDAGLASAINVMGLAGEVFAIGATVWLWRGPRVRDDPRLGPRFALTVLVGLLLSPHVNPQDALTLVPVGAIAYGAARGHPLSRWLGIALFLAPFVTLATNPLSVTNPGSPPIRTPVVLMIALAIWLAWWLRSGRGRPPVDAAARPTILAASSE